MKTWEYLTGDMGMIYRPAMIAAVAIALLGAILSVPVVLKRLAFIGQGISHAAFGGAGVALVLGLGGIGTSTATSLGYLAVVGTFCVVTALAIAWASDHSASARGVGASSPASAGATGLSPRARSGEAATSEDTLIGVFLVASMALGSLLTKWQSLRAPGSQIRSAEQILFGSINDVAPPDAIIAWAVLALTLAVLLYTRRSMVFWLFDEPAAEAFGVRTRALRYLLLALLGIATVTAMKLAGAVLATAVLIIPGAVALKLSERLSTVVLLACIVGLLGMLGGMVLSFEMDWPPGACVVTVLAAQYLLATLWARVRG
jgi:zinc transport system permease protein